MLLAVCVAEYDQRHNCVRMCMWTSIICICTALSEYLNYRMEYWCFVVAIPACSVPRPTTTTPKKKPPPVSKCTVKMQLLQSSFERRVTAPMHNLTASYACSDVIMHVGVVDVIASSKYKLAYMLNTYEYTCLTQVILWISVFCSFQLFFKDPETIQTNINSSNTFLLIYKVHI